MECKRAFKKFFKIQFFNIKSLKKEDSREPVREQWKTEMDTEDSNEEKQQYKTLFIILFMNPVAISSTQK